MAKKMVEQDGQSISFMFHSFWQEPWSKCLYTNTGSCRSCTLCLVAKLLRPTVKCPHKDTLSGYMVRRVHSISTDIIKIIFYHTTKYWAYFGVVYHAHEVSSRSQFRLTRCNNVEKRRPWLVRPLGGKEYKEKKYPDPILLAARMKRNHEVPLIPHCLIVLRTEKGRTPIMHFGERTSPTNLLCPAAGCRQKRLLVQSGLHTSRSTFSGSRQSANRPYVCFKHVITNLPRFYLLRGRSHLKSATAIRRLSKWTLW
jgi:hypothetical protein